MKFKYAFLMIILTTGANFEAYAFAPKCIDLFGSLESQSETFNAHLEKFRNEIGSSKFNQNRSITELGPFLIGMMTDLPSGSIVVDLGAGKGSTVASAVIGTDAIPTHSLFSDSIVSPDLLKRLSHLNFLGITATPANLMDVPLEGPGGRYKILAGKILEDIPDDLLRSILDRKMVIAFSKVGVFEYTPTPDLAFEKVYNMLPIGGRLVLTPHENAIQKTNGEVINYLQYAEECGFKQIKNLSRQHNTWVLEKTEKPFQRIPLKIIFTKGNRPPTRLFRVDDSTLSKDQRVALDIRYASENRFAYFINLSLYQLNESFKGYYESLSGKGSDRDKRYQGLEVAAIDHLYPGQSTVAFSDYVIYGLKEKAARYFDDHPTSFQIFPEEALFFQALRDLLGNIGDSVALTKVASIIKESQPQKESGVALMLSQLIKQHKNMEWDTQDGNYFEVSTQLRLELDASRRGSLSYLVAAWNYSPEAQNWLSKLAEHSTR